MTTALLCQLILLLYHQATTCFDLFPFNGARHYTSSQRWAEMGSNAILMGLAPIGFAFDVHALKVYGAYYYFVLFAVEIIVWWIPYFTVPGGIWRRVYNVLLSVSTSNYEQGDTLSHWLDIHRKLHAGTWTILPQREGRIVPNVEHTLLHVLTLVTAGVTFRAVYA